MHAPWDRARKVRVGLLVLGSAILFVGLLVFTVGLGLSSQSRSYYLLLDENVKGLVIGSRVNFQGVPVGAVRDILFHNGQTRVELSCDPSRAVIQDVTRARLDRLLVTGQVTVELEGFADDAEPLAPGSMIQPKPSPLTELAAALPDVAHEASALVVEMRRLATNLNVQLEGPLPGEVRATLADLRGLIAETRGAVAESRGAIAETRGAMVAIQRGVERFEQLEEEGISLLAETRGVVGTARSPLLALLEAARQALDEMRVLTRQLGAAPSSLIYGARAQELAVPAPGMELRR